MGLSLDFVQSRLCEVTNGKGVTDTEAIDSLVKTIGFSAGQVTAVYDFGKVVALL